MACHVKCADRMRMLPMGTCNAAFMSAPEARAAATPGSSPAWAALPSWKLAVILEEEGMVDSGAGVSKSRPKAQRARRQLQGGGRRRHSLGAGALTCCS